MINNKFAKPSNPVSNESSGEAELLFMTQRTQTKERSSGKSGMDLNESWRYRIYLYMLNRHTYEVMKKQVRWVTLIYDMMT